MGDKIKTTKGRETFNQIPKLKHSLKELKRICNSLVHFVHIYILYFIIFSGLMFGKRNAEPYKLIFAFILYSMLLFKYVAVFGND